MTGCLSSQNKYRHAANLSVSSHAVKLAISKVKRSEIQNRKKAGSRSGVRSKIQSADDLFFFYSVTKPIEFHGSLVLYVVFKHKPQICPTRSSAVATVNQQDVVVSSLFRLYI